MRSRTGRLHRRDAAGTFDLDAAVEWPFCQRCVDLAGPDIMEDW